jgi:uncharacterized protein YndB with AHSA1/START domain
MIAPSTSCTDDAIVAEVLINAPRASVWAALTQTRLLESWWGSPDTYRADGWTLDLRAGGKWESRGTSVDGSKFSVCGEFVEVSPIDRLVMTWKPSWDPTPPTTINYQLSEEGAATRLRMMHTGFRGYEQSRDSHSNGWQRVLGWLGDFVERNAPFGSPSSGQREVPNP